MIELFIKCGRISRSLIHQYEVADLTQRCQQLYLVNYTVRTVANEQQSVVNNLADHLFQTIGLLLGGMHVYLADNCYTYINS